MTWKPHKPLGENTGDILYSASFFNAREEGELIEDARKYCRDNGYTNQTHRIAKRKSGTQMCVLVIKK